MQSFMHLCTQGCKVAKLKTSSFVYVSVCEHILNTVKVSPLKRKGTPPNLSVSPGRQYVEGFWFLFFGFGFFFHYQG